MERPNEINILGIKYKVEYCDKPSDVDIFKRESCWGQIDYWTRTIRIYEHEFPHRDVWQTVFYEIIHGIIQQMHLEDLIIKDDYPHKNMEKLVDCLSLGIMNVLFENKWFKE